MKFHLLISLLIASSLYGNVQNSNNLQPNRINLLYTASGVSLLAFQFAGIPLLDVAINYQKFPKLINPLSQIFEKEPFIEDKLWHLVGAATFTDLNYYLFKYLLNSEHPLILSGITSFSFWTGMECVDAIMGNGFSLLDESGNILGIALGIIMLRYPDLPFRVRLGVKNWNEFIKATSRVASGKLHKEIGSQYNYMKVEFVYLFPSTSLYTGLAVSRKEHKQNQFGITSGFDLLDWVVKKKNGWWNSPVKLFDNHFSVNLELTIWMN
jgi:hypothetical protein